MQNSLAEVLDNIDVLVYVADIKTYEILYVNEYTRKLFGDIKGKICWQTIQSGQVGPCSFCTNDKIVSAEGKPTGLYHWEFQNTVTDRWFDIRDTAITWHDGRIVRLEVATEITNHKKTEEALKESEQYLQSIINTEPECVKVVLRDGTLMTMNPAGLKMIEAQSLEQVKGKSVYPIVTPKYRNAFRELTESVCRGNEGSLEFEIVGLKGTHRWLETRAVSLRNTKNEIIGLLGITRDITEHKAAQEKLIQKNKELEQVLYVTSHDLRSPLVNIEGFSRELDYSMKGLIDCLDNRDIPESVKDKMESIVKNDMPESLQFIHKSVFKMDTLIKGILNLSRIGRFKLTIENIDMNELFVEVISSHEFRVNEAGITMKVSALPKCRGDKVRLNQLFSNLLDNAIKYLDPERSGVIKVSGHTQGDQSVYCVEDNGIGIAPEHQEEIFEIFHQLEPDKAIGEGLGLTIVHRIVEMLKGRIWVESEIGKGSKFFVSLPS